MPSLKRIFSHFAASLAILGTISVAEAQERPYCQPFNFIDLHCDKNNEPLAHVVLCPDKDIVRHEFNPETGLDDKEVLIMESKKAYNILFNLNDFKNTMKNLEVIGASPQYILRVKNTIERARQFPQHCPIKKPAAPELP